MQFREQGRRIQCIRSTYDPSRKRCYQRVIVSFSKLLDRLPADLGGLTPSERQELEAWFKARQEAKNEEEDRLRVSTAAESLARLANAITAVGISADGAAAVWAGLSAVGKALQRAGYQRPKRAYRKKSFYVV